MSAGLKVQTAHDLFREYVDEPSSGFMSSANVARYLEYGLDQWRDLIRRHNPHMFGTSVEFHADTTNPSNYLAQAAATKPERNTLDLGNAALQSSLSNIGVSTAIMGPTANIEWDTGAKLAGPPIDTILDVYTFSKDNRARGTRLRQLQGNRALELSALAINYTLQGTVLQFNGTPPESFILEYFPRPVTKDFSYTNTTDYLAGGILPQFHELIVLLSSKRYMMRDGEPNQLILGEMAGQVEAMVLYLSGTQLARSRESVTVTTQF